MKVLAANISDREDSKLLFLELRVKQPQMRLHVFADGGYRGKWEGWVKTNMGHTVEIVQRPDANTRGYWLPQDQELTEAQLNDPALKVQGFGKRLKSPSLFEDERLRVLI
ncbi:hypothetical protein DESA109040_08915 [Deinococcus saxicola]